MRFDSSLRSPYERAKRIRAGVTEISTQMRMASRLVMATIRLSYDFFTVACLTAAALIVIAGSPREAFVWGGTGVGLAIGWVAAKLAKRGVARLRGVLREEWGGASTMDAGRGRDMRDDAAAE